MPHTGTDVQEDSAVTTTKPLPGTRDRFGAELRRRDFAAATLLETAYARGFERLAVPMLERAESFSEQVVGRSPWPEWNPRGVFTVPVPGYTKSYTETTEVTTALLIPEGTVSVARWIAGRLREAEAGALPVKVCYDLPCHRNEPLDTLNGTKFREFSQFGVEILGAANPAADAEIITFIYDALAALGVPSETIRARINNVSIFTRAVTDSRIPHETAIAIKEHLDALAECRAGKDPERSGHLRKTLADILDQLHLTDDQRAVWDLLAGHSSGTADGNTRQILGPAHADDLDALEAMRTSLIGDGIRTVIDLGVVRSHEYYTGVSFEVDVKLPDGRLYAEIAGGGRYDKLIGHFTTSPSVTAIPSTGFAFGIERLLTMLADIGVFDRAAVHSIQHRFDDSSAEVLLVPRKDTATVAGYLRARREADRRLRRVDIWVGENDRDAIAGYAAARGIGEVNWC